MIDGEVRYRLSNEAARRRACASALLGALTSLAPILFAFVLLSKLGWRPPAALWAVACALVALVVVRAAVAYQGAQRRLRSLVVVLRDDAIRVVSSPEGYAVARTAVARISEIDGPLGGLRVESEPDPRTGGTTFVHVPRGGEAFGEVRACLERWRAIERRGRRGPALRLALGAAVVAGIFFVPFLLDDFVAHSKVVAAALVVGMWLVTRAVLKKS